MKYSMHVSVTKERMVKPQSQEFKKPYLPPRLRVYGNIRTLTATTSAMMSTADAAMATTKT